MKSSSGAPKDPVVSLSKKLSRALRHEAANMGLSISSEGFVSLTELLAHTDFKRVNVQDVKNVVYSTDLKRFDIVVKDDKEYIRACTGHTIPIVNASLLQKQFRENPNYDKSSNSVKNVGVNASNAQNATENVSQSESSPTYAPSTVAPGAAAAAATAAPPKPNAWNTKAPVFIPSSAVLANLPTPISHLNRPVIIQAPTALVVDQPATVPVAAPPTTAGAVTAPVVVPEPETVKLPVVPKVDENLGIDGPIDPIPADVVMPTAGVWLRTALYEPKGTLGPQAEQDLSVVWVQAKSGHFVDLRVPPVKSSGSDDVTTTATVQPHNRRVVKSFAGVATFDHALAHQEWQRRIDVRAVPAKDVGHIRLLSGGAKMVEDSALPEDDYREIWTRQVAPAKKNASTAVSGDVAVKETDKAADVAEGASTSAAAAAAAAPKKLWSSIVAPAAAATAPSAVAPSAAAAVDSGDAKKAASESSSEVVAVFVHRKPSREDKSVLAEETVGYFLQVDGHFALSLNLRGVDLTSEGVAAPSGRRPTVAELRNYFNNVVSSASAPAAPVPTPVVPAAAAVVETKPAAAAGFSYAAMTKKATSPTPATTSTTAPAVAASPSAALTDAQIEDFLSRYVTVVGHSSNNSSRSGGWIIDYALQSSMVGQTLTNAVFTHGAASVKLLDLLKKLHINVVSGKVPKFLSSAAAKEASVAGTSAAAGVSASGAKSETSEGKKKKNGSGRDRKDGSSSISDNNKNGAERRRREAKDKGSSNSSNGGHAAGSGARKIDEGSTGRK